VYSPSITYFGPGEGFVRANVALNPAFISSVLFMYF